MVDDTKLWCLIQGDIQPVLHPVSADKRIVNLRRDIWERGKNSVLRGVCAKDLVLWKIDEEVIIEPAAGLAKRVADRPPKRSILESGHNISTDFPAPVNDEILHIIVERRISEQSHREDSDPNPDIDPVWSRREQTVKRLFERLQREALVHIRGTPASGKSTLLKLVHEHILRCRPDAIVRIVRAWPQGSFQGLGPIDRFRRLIPGYPFSEPRNTYILFDNGHQTYWDGELWEYFIKDQVQSGYLYRVILFCGYGNPSNRPVWYSGGVPPVVGPWSRVSLRRRNERGDDDDEEGIGLLLSRPEFDEYMANFNYFPLDSGFQDMVFEWTNGHAGAIDGIWQIIKSQKQNGSLEAYTVEEFYQLNPWETYFAKLGQADFARGLPTKVEMQNPNVANVMRKLLKNWTIGTGETDEEKEAVNTCHENGWIQADLIRTRIYEHDKIVYSFASPLHGVYISQQFTTPDAQIPPKTLTELTFDVVQRYKPVQLSGSTQVGTHLTPRPTEAKYQDEFYRRLGELVGDSIRISPEFLTAANAKMGCTNFFLPTQRWGISVTHEGNNLLEHYESFGLHGAYGAWLTSNVMVDWILLDCCTKMPEDHHDDMSNLFYAVFMENYTEVTLLDNKLKELKKFVLGN